MDRHYAIFWTDATTNRPMWARARTKRIACQHGRRVSGLVGMVPYESRAAWDAPTFKVSATVVADYRQLPDRKVAGAHVIGS